jgi:raffinose/stachyose/melibiose transport system permease protein
MKKTKEILYKVIVGLITLAFAFPMYLALVNVFKTLKQIRYHPAALPDPFTMDNIIQVLKRPDHLIFVGLMNSLFITTVTVFLLVVFSATIGYYIARSDSKWSKILLMVFIAGMLTPPQVTLIPVTRILAKLHLMYSFKGLIFFFVGSGLLSFAVFVYSGFIKTIPKELDESALIDGASKFTLFWKIIFPLMRPATATVVIYLALWTWNDFLLPLIIVGPTHGVTITTGVYVSVGTFTSDYGQIFAMMLLSALPMLIFFFSLQKEFIAGLTSGSLKG